MKLDRAKYLERIDHEVDDVIICAYELLLDAIEQESEGLDEFYPGFSIIVKANVLNRLYHEYGERTRHHVYAVDYAWKKYLGPPKTSKRY